MHPLEILADVRKLMNVQYVRKIMLDGLFNDLMLTYIHSNNR